MALEEKKILLSPLMDTSLSKELKSHFLKQNYKTLQDVLETKASGLLTQPGFTYHMLQDFLQFLKQNNLAALLKE